MHYDPINLLPKAANRIIPAKGAEGVSENLIPADISAATMASWIADGKISTQTAVSYLSNRVKTDPGFVSDVLVGLAKIEEKSGVFAFDGGSRESSKTLKILAALDPKDRATIARYIFENYGTSSNCRYDRINKERDFTSQAIKFMKEFKVDENGNITNKNEIHDKQGFSIRKKFELIALSLHLNVNFPNYITNVGEIYNVFGSEPGLMLGLLLSTSGRKPAEVDNEGSSVDGPNEEAAPASPSPPRTAVKRIEVNGIVFVIAEDEAANLSAYQTRLEEIAAIVNQVNLLLPKGWKITTIKIVGDTETTGGHYDHKENRNTIFIGYGQLVKGNYKSTIWHEEGHAVYRSSETSPNGPITKANLSILKKCYSALLILSQKTDISAFELFDESNYAEGVDDYYGHPNDGESELFASASNLFINHADELAYNIEHAEDPMARKIGIIMWCLLRDVYGNVFTSDGVDPFAEYELNGTLLKGVDDLIASEPKPKTAASPAHPRKK